MSQIYPLEVPSVDFERIAQIRTAWRSYQGMPFRLRKNQRVGGGTGVFARPTMLFRGGHDF
jgi:hypothetical protein